MTLVYKNERMLFAVSLAISALLWLALIGITFGIALVYMLFFFILYLFAHSAFISHLKGTAVRITPEQFPDLYERVSECCERLNVRPQPEAYLLHAHGALNAFATRFLGRNFIVLYSDVVDALEQNPEAINFYIGHELGHIHRRHLVWGPLLWPAGVLPLIGAGYSRAREYTCDLYGLRCCDDPKAAIHGLAALAAGHRRWQTINVDEYAAQAGQTGGFWMSFHELISDYPWLVKRMARIRQPGKAGAPGRSLLAWLFAMWVPRLGPGGGASFIVTVAMIGILAAVAIPAYRDYTARATIMGAVNFGERATHAVDRYIARTHAIPRDLADAGVAASSRPASVSSVAIDDKNAIVEVMLAAPPLLQGKSILFVPSRDTHGKILWRCASENIKPKYLPAKCRPPQDGQATP